MSRPKEPPPADCSPMQRGLPTPGFAGRDYSMKGADMSSELAKFDREDFAHTASSLRCGNEPTIKATLSNNFNVILAALDIASAEAAEAKCAALQADVDELRKALEGLVEEHAFICRHYSRKPAQPWHAAEAALSKVKP